MKTTTSTNCGRRVFLKTTALSSLAITLPGSLWSMLPQQKAIKVGLIADLHQDVIHNGKQRLEAFLKEMQQQNPDALIQMGDFAYPGDVNKEVIQLFNEAHEKSLHVIGNHDTDAGYTKDQCVSYWGMPAPYYVETISGIHFLVLDGNEKGSPTRTGGYAAYIGEAQWRWMIEQLETLEGPVVIVSHQPLAGPLAVDNAVQMQAILGRYSHKILLAINGHSHIDMVVRKKGVSYLHINSASYYWVGGDHRHKTYGQEVHKDFPWIEYTCPYKESLFALLTIDPSTQTVNIQGRSSAWVGPSPANLGADSMPGVVHGVHVAPHIRDYTIEHPRGK